jgi:DNA topoisomerase VI subunit A
MGRRGWCVEDAPYAFERSRTLSKATSGKDDAGGKRATRPKKHAAPPRDRAAAGERIAKLAREVVGVVHQREDPYVDIPSRTLSNVRFNEHTRIIELLDGTQRRSFFSLLGRRKGEGSQAKKFMQTLRVAQVCRQLIDAADSTSIRDLFYNLKVPI